MNKPAHLGLAVKRKAKYLHVNNREKHERARK